MSQISQPITTGSQLHQLRQRIGLSLSQMGGLLQVTNCRLSEWERGERLIPNTSRPMLQLIQDQLAIWEQRGGDPASYGQILIERGGIPPVLPPVEPPSPTVAPATPAEI